MGGLHHGPHMFSSGKVVLTKDHVAIFLPDSSFIFHVSESKCYYDSSLPDSRKIILNNIDNRLAGYTFQFEESDSPLINFDTNYSSVYQPIKNYDDNGGWIIITAKSNDSIIIYPRPLHSSISSNALHFSDLNINDPDDKPWNVLVLNVSINPRMFSFKILPQYIYTKKEFIERNCPVYTLKR